MVIPIQVWNTMRSNAELLSRINLFRHHGSARPRSSLQQVKDLFEIQKHSSSPRASTTHRRTKGQVDAFGYIWGKSIWMGYVTDAALARPALGGATKLRLDGRLPRRGLPAGVDGLGNEGPGPIRFDPVARGPVSFRTYDTVRPAHAFTIDAEDVHGSPNVTAADLGMTFTGGHPPKPGASAEPMTQI